MGHWGFEAVEIVEGSYVVCEDKAAQKGPTETHSHTNFTHSPV